MNGALVNFTINPGTGGSVVFNGNGSNALSGVRSNADLTFPDGSFTQLYNISSESGTIALAQEPGNGVIRFQDSSARLNLSATGRMRGFGATGNFFGGDVLDNGGAISADVSGKLLRLGNSNVTGGGLFEAKNGGVLVISTVLNGSGASGSAPAGSTVVVDSGTVTGTFAASTGSGITFNGNGNNRLDAATVGGNLTFPDGSFASLHNVSSVSGTIALAQEPGNGLMRLYDSNARLTLTATAQMRGFGATGTYFGGDTLTNSGAISADVSGKLLRLANTTVTGSGLFEAKNGGVLVISTVLNGSGASVDAPAGSTVIVDAGGISGTFASSTGSGISFNGNGNNRIDTATVNGNLTFPDGSYARLYNASTFTGIIAMSQEPGTGQVQLNDSNAQLTLAGGVLRGFGTTGDYFGGGTLVNNGFVSADVPGKILRLAHSNTTGGGLFESKNGGILAITTILTCNNAAVGAQPGSAVVVDGGAIAGSFAASTGTGISFNGNGNNRVDAATVNGNLTFGDGSYGRFYNLSSISGIMAMSQEPGNGQVQFQNGNAQLTIAPGGMLRGFGVVSDYFGGGRLLNQGAIFADVPGKTLNFLHSSTTNTGLVNIVPGAVLASIGTFTQISGVVQVNGTFAPASPLVIGGGFVVGDGTITSSVRNVAGIVAPIGPTSPGSLDVLGSLTLESGSLFDVQLEGYNQGLTYSLLNVVGDAMLGGAIRVDLVNGFTPQIGDFFDVLLSPSVTGTFNSLLTLDDPGFACTVEYKGLLKRY